ncbi:MAG: ABC transporter substrate-binding protein [Thermodesulfobacteriota bacterium]|nr:ABC transporter substrate-binding protein [Thermodesulfobacteriota bacterium]
MATGVKNRIERYRGFLLSTFSLTLFVLLLAGCDRKAPREDLHTLNIGYGRSIDSLPLYVGVDQGFFDQAGVRVNLRVIRDARSTIGAILHGDLDGGLFGFPQIVFSLENKVPVKVIAWPGRSHPGTRCGLHVWKYSDIRRVEDLKGKKVAMGRDVSTRTLVGALLVRHGMTFDDIQVSLGIELGEPMKTEAAFKSDRVSAIYT